MPGQDDTMSTAPETSPVALDADDRADLLKYAAGISLDPSDAAAVAGAAFCLMDWAEQAAGKRDLRERMLALRAQWVNAGSRARTGNPAAFLAAAQILYAFTTAGEGQVSPR